MITSEYDFVEYKGRSLMDWALEWFRMSNDTFFDIYGFNFNPHKYPNLYEDARERYFQNQRNNNLILPLRREGIENNAKNTYIAFGNMVNNWNS